MIVHGWSLFGLQCLGVRGPLFRLPLGACSWRWQFLPVAAPSTWSGKVLLLCTGACERGITNAGGCVSTGACECGITGVGGRVSTGAGSHEEHGLV